MSDTESKPPECRECDYCLPHPWAHPKFKDWCIGEGLGLAFVNRANVNKCGPSGKWFKEKPKVPEVKKNKSIFGRLYSWLFSKI